jgi:hypothetical protein
VHKSGSEHPEDSPFVKTDAHYSVQTQHDEALTRELGFFTDSTAHLRIGLLTLARRTLLGATRFWLIGQQLNVIGTQ